MRLYNAICLFIEAKAQSLGYVDEPQKEGATSMAEAYRIGFYADPEMHAGFRGGDDDD